MKRKFATSRYYRFFQFYTLCNYDYFNFRTLYPHDILMLSFLSNVFEVKINSNSIMNTVGIRVATRQIRRFSVYFHRDRCIMTSLQIGVQVTYADFWTFSKKQCLL
jgi:hypothetical protein